MTRKRVPSDIVNPRLAAAALPPSPLPAAWDSHRDRTERLRMVTKLFSMFPLSKGQDMELAMAGYIEHTMDIPTHWMSVGLFNLLQDDETVFVPPVGKIRRAAAVAYRESLHRSDWTDASSSTENLLAKARLDAGMLEDRTLAVIRAVERTVEAMTPDLRSLVDGVERKMP